MIRHAKEPARSQGTQTRAALSVDDRHGDEAREEQAQNDRELAESDEASADVGGGDLLGGMAGGNRGRRAPKPMPPMMPRQNG